MADYYQKRRNLALEAVNAAEKFTDALNELLALKDERSKLPEDFQDGDFSIDSNLRHLTSGMIGVLFDFVVPSFKANFDDSENGGRNKQILLQVRK